MCEVNFQYIPATWRILRSTFPLDLAKIVAGYFMFENEEQIHAYPSIRRACDVLVGSWEICSEGLKSIPVSGSDSNEGKPEYVWLSSTDVMESIVRQEFPECLDALLTHPKVIGQHELKWLKLRNEAAWNRIVHHPKFTNITVWSVVDL